MTTEPLIPPRPLPAILTEVKNAILSRFLVRLGEAGFDDIREGHGCVFGFIDVEHGSRLTDLAERSGLTKQAVGETVAHLEGLGYVERVPDPKDRRAKIIKLTPRGLEAAVTGRRLFAEIEREWAEQLGDKLLAGLREGAERIAAAERDEGLRGRPRSAA
ncbi:MAG TPA: MarR family transcriptional regulator [Beijerinckiaceae bacterium]|nr:MarR family transcriptional regulator [Beijerinckiaceae bacterium]